MGVLVILEMDGGTDALLTAAADIEARRPTSAVQARIVAPTETGAQVPVSEPGDTPVRDADEVPRGTDDIALAFGV